MTSHEALEILVKYYKCYTIEFKHCAEMPCDRCEYDVNMTQMTKALVVAIEIMEQWESAKRS